MKIGDPCRARCTAAARYIGHARCLFVTNQANGLGIDEAHAAIGNEHRAALPTDEEVDQFARELEERIEMLEGDE